MKKANTAPLLIAALAFCLCLGGAAGFLVSVLLHRNSPDSVLEKQQVTDSLEKTDMEDEAESQDLFDSESLLETQESPSLRRASEPDEQKSGYVEEDRESLPEKPVGITEEGADDLPGEETGQAEDSSFDVQDREKEILPSGSPYENAGTEEPEMPPKETDGQREANATDLPEKESDKKETSGQEGLLKEEIPEDLPSSTADRKEPEEEPASSGFPGNGEKEIFCIVSPDDILILKDLIAIHSLQELEAFLLQHSSDEADAIFAWLSDFGTKSPEQPENSMEKSGDDKNAAGERTEADSDLILDIFKKYLLFVKAINDKIYFTPDEDVTIMDNGEMEMLAAGESVEISSLAVGNGTLYFETASGLRIPVGD